jgi:hypothetical protein
MRTVTLARVAAEAEGLYIKGMIRRQVRRVVFAIVGGVFFMAALGVAHAVAWTLLTPYLAPLYALLAILGFDVLLGVIMLALAASDRPSATEREALEIRHKATSQLGSSLASFMMLRPLIRLLPGRHLYGVLLAGLTARHLSRR